MELSRFTSPSTGEGERGEGEAEVPGRKRDETARGTGMEARGPSSAPQPPVLPLLKDFSWRPQHPQGRISAPPKPPQRKRSPAEQVAVPFFCWAGVGERELAEDTGLARSAYMSSESALRTELLLDEALDTEETLLTLRDLPRTNSSHHTAGLPASPCTAACWQARQTATHEGRVSWGAAGMKNPKAVGCRPGK